jgi:DNA-binding NtrC family response regulator
MSIAYDPKKTLGDISEQYQRSALIYFSGNIRQASYALGVGLATLQRRIDDWGIREQLKELRKLNTKGGQNGEEKKEA